MTTCVSIGASVFAWGFCLGFPCGFPHARDTNWQLITDNWQPCRRELRFPTLTNGSPLTHEIFTATFIATFIATFDENRLKPNRSQGLSPFSKPIDFSVCYENCEIIVKFNASCHLYSTIHININSVIDGQWMVSLLQTDWFVVVRFIARSDDVLTCFFLEICYHFNVSST